jgi:hypothetical protein
VCHVRYVSNPCCAGDSLLSRVLWPAAAMYPEGERAMAAATVDYPHAVLPSPLAAVRRVLHLGPGKGAVLATAPVQFVETTCFQVHRCRRPAVTGGRCSRCRVPTPQRMESTFVHPVVFVLLLVVLCCIFTTCVG